MVWSWERFAAKPKRDKFVIGLEMLEESHGVLILKDSDTGKVQDAIMITGVGKNWWIWLCDDQKFASIGIDLKPISV